MKELIKLIPLLLCLVALPAAASQLVPTNAYPLKIVSCRDGVDVDALLKEFQLVPDCKLEIINGFAALMDATTLQSLKADGRVLSVEADGPVTLCDQTNSTGIVRMGLDHFPLAHINGVTEPLDVGVAVMDSGIDTNHPDLKVYGTFLSYSTTGDDDGGHGTSVAGVIAAQDNGFGLVGVAPGVRLWNIKTVGPPPNNSWVNVTKAMNYVLQHSNDISIVNMSFANQTVGAPISTLGAAIRKLVSVGIVLVAAVGNITNDLAGSDDIYATDDDAVPAAFPEVMAVSAMDPTTDTQAVFSNFSQIPRTNFYTAGESNYVFSPGGAIDVAAPGVNILTTATNSGYAIYSGTSLSAPYVTGLVALYIAAHGRATNAAGVYAIRQAIVNASLPQSQWNTNNTHDPDTNPEPLAIASESWVPQPAITNFSGTPGNFQVSFTTVPGYDYTVQSTTNLSLTSAWTSLATISGSSNLAPVSVTDANVADQIFYRLARTPSP